MGRIATLTFQGADSYGAMLQAYALQKVITGLGYDTEILNYACEAIDNSYKMPHTLRGLVARTCRTPYYQIRQSRFRKFRGHCLTLSDKVTSDELEVFANRYDAIVVGSDQVWNPLLTKGDLAYFLPFLDSGKRKISYAASMGLTAWKDGERDIYLPLLESFDFLSVREKTASDYLARYGVQTEVVCDPTLLLAKEDYIAIEGNSLVAYPYTLLFCLEEPFAESVAFTRELARERGERLVVIHNGKFPVPKAKNVRGAGPCEFLTLIHNASAVVTESFHGICFSLMFEKDFFYFDPRTMKKSLSRSSRITDLLASINLLDRVVTSTSRPTLMINYPEVRARLSVMRGASIAALKRSLK